jgi:hypothetical protein
MGAALTYAGRYALLRPWGLLARRSITIEEANRIDPGSCAAAGEGIGEALTGDRTGQPLRGTTINDPTLIQLVGQAV